MKVTQWDITIHFKCQKSWFYTIWAWWASKVRQSKLGWVFRPSVNACGSFFNFYSFLTTHSQPLALIYSPTDTSTPAQHWNPASLELTWKPIKKKGDREGVLIMPSGSGKGFYYYLFMYSALECSYLTCGGLDCPLPAVPISFSQLTQ